MPSTKCDLRESRPAEAMDLHHAYELFRKSYEAETGTAWSEAKFLSRAQQWHFYGDDDGFVAVRRQHSGMTKLVGVAGDLRSILRGLAELQQEPGPLWGAVSAPLAQMAAKRGMIVPHRYPGGSTLIRIVLTLVPASVFGGERPQVTADGGVLFNYADTGAAVKYLIGNKSYFQAMLRLPEVKQRLNQVPGAATLLRLLGIAG